MIKISDLTWPNDDYKKKLRISLDGVLDETSKGGILKTTKDVMTSWGFCEPGTAAERRSATRHGEHHRNAWHRDAIERFSTRIGDRN